MKSYQPTALEMWVSDLYKRLEIYTPKDIKVNKIKRIYSIFIKQAPVAPYFFETGRFRCIYVDSREPIRVQREQFFHEWCHLLRHCGKQTMLPEAFRELQEWDARNFTRYALIPHHMLDQINWNDEYLIEHVSNLFRTTEDMAAERMDQVKRRSYVLIKHVK